MRHLNRFAIASALIFAATGAWGQTVQFSRIYPFRGIQTCNGLAGTQDASDNMYLTGSDEAQALTEKYTNAGALSWSNTIPDASPQFITNNVFTYVAGQSFYENSIFVSSIFNGATDWTYRDSAYDSVNGLTVDGTSSLYFAAQRVNSTSQQDFDVVKLNATTGQLLWKQTVAYSLPYTNCLGLAEANGHLYALATTPNGSALASYIVTAFDVNTGHPLWTQGIYDYGNVVNTAAQQIYVAPSGDALVIGTGSDSSSSDSLVTFYDIDATTGAFTNRTSEDVSPSSFTATFLNSTQDSLGNLYFAESSTNGVNGFSSLGEIAINGTYPYLTTEKIPSISANLIARTTGLFAALVQNTSQGAFQTEDNQELIELDLSGNFVASAFYSEPSHLFPARLPPSSAAVFGTVEDPTTGRNGFGVIDQSNNLLVRDDPSGSVSGELERIATDAQDNMYTAGSTYGNMFVAKVSANGVFLWQNTINFGVPGWTGAPRLLKYFPNGDIVLAAFNLLTDSTELVKINSATGATVWEIVDSSATIEPSQLLEDGAGNVIVCGTDTGASQLVVTSYAAGSGAITWQHHYVARSADGNDLGQDSAGNFYAVGRAASGTKGLVILKLDASGNQLYADFAPDPSPTGFGGQIAVDSAGNAYVGFGQTGSVYIIKLDPSGHTLFRKAISESSNDTIEISSFFLSGGKLFVVTNNEDDVAGTLKGIAYKMTPSGGLSWRNEYDAASFADNFALVKGGCDAGGNLYVIGGDSSFSNSPDAALRKVAANSRPLRGFPSAAFLIKINGNTGKNLWIYHFAGGSKSAALLDLSVTSDGKAVMVGESPDAEKIVTSIAFAALVK